MKRLLSLIESHSARVLGGLLVALLTGLAGPRAAHAAECIVECTSKAMCKVDNGESPEAPFAPGNIVRVKVCQRAHLHADDMSVAGLYQGERGPVQFTIKQPRATEAFGAQVPGIASAKCGIGGSCLEERDLRRKNEPGGMGADEVKFVHEGAPCALGLPCGLVMKPARMLSIFIAGGGTGSLGLTGTRGTDKSTSRYEMTGGHIDIPASALVAGGVYRYEFKAGDTAATGEFSVISGRMQRDIEDAIAESATQEPGAAALGTVRILLEENLVWDATQTAH